MADDLGDRAFQAGHASPFCNHHSMDVVRPFEGSVAKVGRSNRDRIATAILEMLDWCLLRSLKPDFDDFEKVDDNDTIDRHAFLKLAGYCEETPFWWGAERQRRPDRPLPRRVAPRLLDAVDRLNRDSPMSTTSDEPCGR